MASRYTPGFRIPIHFIRIQGFYDQKMEEKNLQLEKKILGGQKQQFYLSLGLHKGRPSYKRSLQFPARQNMKFLNFFNFCGSFFPSWIRIPNTNPDPLTWLNPDPIRVRIQNLARYTRGPHRDVVYLRNLEI
jgi:hypothetical protein